MSNSPIILVAEPEESIRKSIDIVLTDEGYKCHCVPDKASLLDEIHACKPDLIIADIHILYHKMPEIVLSLNQYETHPPILVMLSYERVYDMLYLMKFNVTEYLVKPFAFEDMLERIPKLISHPSNMASK